MHSSTGKYPGGEACLEQPRLASATTLAPSFPSVTVSNADGPTINVNEPTTGGSKSAGDEGDAGDDGGDCAVQRGAPRLQHYSGAPVVNQYVRMLEKDHNVICIHQRPPSPATNILDLGVGMALQSVVEKLHHNQRQELNALCSTVKKAREDLDKVNLTIFYEKWKIVLDLILKNNSGDKFIEANRGKLFRSPSREAEHFNEASMREAVDIEDMKGNDIENIDIGLV